MNIRNAATIAALTLFGAAAMAQPPDFFGGRGPGGPGGPGGFGGPPGGGSRKILSQFDKDDKGYLNAAERKAAREYLAANPSGRGGFGRRGGMGGGAAADVQAGVKLTPSQVKIYGKEPLYELGVLRTLFLEFEDADWEQEIMDFYRTDVDVPAKLTVDGKVLAANVGVHFRGMTSYMAVPKGKKHSINLSVNFMDKDQRVAGYRTLNLLNSNSDPTFLRTALYQYISRQYIAAPKANYMRVAINGESWGVFVNVEQFNSDFTLENYGSAKGTRWKTPGSPGGRAGLAYRGDDPAPYKSAYEIKTKDDPKAWSDLIHLCKVLNQTPPEQLEKALEPILDTDGALRFLALDKTLINNDGYWVRTSDYSLYEDPKGKFHLTPQDANETLREVEMMGGRGRGGGNSAAGGVALDPMANADDPEKALMNRLLAVPALKAKYLGYVKDIAEKWLDWSRLGPLAAQFQAVIAEDIKKDTKKLDSTENFSTGVTRDREAEAPAAGGDFPGPPGFGPGGPGGPGGRGGRGGFNDAPRLSLKGFAEQRRAYLLNLQEIKNLK
jgi:spore coat protein CotH